MLFANRTLPFFLGNFSQRCLETSEVVDSGTRITAQQVTEPKTNTKSLTHDLKYLVLCYYSSLLYVVVHLID